MNGRGIAKLHLQNQNVTISHVIKPREYFFWNQLYNRFIIDFKKWHLKSVI